MTRDVHRLMHAASRLLDQDRPLEARQLTEAALRYHPDHGPLLTLLGGACYELGDFTAAREALETARLLVPLNDSAQCLLADCYTKSGCIRSALDLLHGVWQKGRCRDALLQVLADAFGRARDYETALTIARCAAQVEPLSPEPLVSQCIYLRQLGYPPSSILPVMAKAARLAPDVVKYRTLLAFLYFETKQADESYRILREIRANELRCACEIRRAMAIFRHCGDFGRWLEYYQRLDDLNIGHGSSPQEL